jgi:arylsulfatase
MNDKKHELNILLITTDEQRFDTLGCNNNPYIKTPNLDRLVAEGINFINHTCSSPICTPSRASILTGQYCRTHGAWDVGYTLGKDLKGLAGWLSKKRYKCGIFGKAHFEPELSNYVEKLYNKKKYYGFSKFKLTEDNLIGEYLDWMKEHYPHHYQNALKLGNESTSALYVDYGQPMRDEGQIKAVFTSDLPENLHQTAWITDRTIDFIKQHAGKNKPFFAWCSYVDPHHPWTPPEPFASMYNPKNLPKPKRKEGENKFLPGFYFYAKNLPDSEFQRMCAAYYGMISHIDYHIGRVINLLEDINQLENTIIIFTSDHGDYNGDHGLIRKSIFLFDNILKVPFLIRLPNKKHAGTNYKGNTQHEDIVPSLFEYLKIPIPDEVQGESFASVLSNGVNGKSREYSFFEYYKYAVGVSKGNWKLIFYSPKNWPWKIVPQIENTKEIFEIVSLPKRGNGFVLTNLEEDPLEFNNLIGDEEYIDIESELKETLFKWLLETPLYYPKKPYPW